MAEHIMIAKAIDQRINIHESPVLVLSESVPAIQFNVVPLTGSPSLNQTYTINCPPNLGLSREVFMSMTVSFTITGTGLTAYNANNAIALRAWPLNSALSSLNINLGSNSVNINASNYQPILTQWNADSAVQNSDFSSFPSAPDVYANYNALVQYSISPFNSPQSSPNSNYSNTSRTQQINASSYVVAGDGTSITFTATITEPIMLSPFTYTGVKDPKKAFFNLSNVVFSMQFTNLFRMLSVAPLAGTTITSIAGNFVGGDNQPRLIFDLISPFEDSILNAVRPTSYNYTSTQFNTSVFANNGGIGAVTSNVSSAVLQFSFIPSYFIIFATPPQSYLNNSAVSSTIPDWNFSISNVSINFAQRSNLIGSNAQPIQLYGLSKKNGSNASFPQWSGQTVFQSGTPINTNNRYGGGALILSTASDLSLPKSTCVGMAYQTNFQITCNITNNSTTNWGDGCQLNVVSFTPGIATISFGGSITLQEGAGITKEMYDDAPPLTTASDEAVKMSSSSNGYAGGSWSSFKHALGSAASHVGHALAPVASAVGKALTNKAVDKGLEYAATLAAAGAGGGKMHRGKVRGLLKSHYF